MELPRRSDARKAQIARKSRLELAISRVIAEDPDLTTSEILASLTAVQQHILGDCLKSEVSGDEE